MTKTCPRCHRRLPLAAFSPSTHTPSGYRVWCKACQARGSKIRYQRDRGYLKPQTWPPRLRQVEEGTHE
jgi:hypothetical protein